MSGVRVVYTFFITRSRGQGLPFVSAGAVALSGRDIIFFLQCKVGLPAGFRCANTAGRFSVNCSVLRAQCFSSIRHHSSLPFCTHDHDVCVNPVKEGIQSRRQQIPPPCFSRQLRCRRAIKSAEMLTVPSDWTQARTVHSSPFLVC